MNMALEGESPYDNGNLFGYLIKHMSVIKTTTHLPYAAWTRIGTVNQYSADNAAFYTTDGMRFEFNNINGDKMVSKLHESDTYLCTNTRPTFNGTIDETKCNGCGSYGLNHNPNGTTKPPCLIMVDVNGDKKPTPGNVNCNNVECGLKSNVYKVPLPAEKKVRDIFSIMITDDRAVPYGITAQKAMYQAQK